MKAVDVAIIGAGPAGLTAAYLLGKAGHSVTVIERDPHYVGGISRTVEHRGFRFDIGGHRFFSKSKAVVDLWDELLPDDFIERPRLSRIYYQGKYYAYPLKAFEALRNLGLLTSTACVLSYDAVRVVADALERAGDVEPTAVRDAIAETELESLLAQDGPITFSDTGENENAAAILMQVLDGQVVPTYPEEYAETEPVYPATPGQ